MDQVGVRELRSNLAGILRRAATGERITVTVDGVPAAEIGPVGPRPDIALEVLIATGLVHPPRRPVPTSEEPDVVDLAVDVRVERVLDGLRGGS